MRPPLLPSILALTFLISTGITPAIAGKSYSSSRSSSRSWSSSSKGSAARSSSYKSSSSSSFKSFKPLPATGSKSGTGSSNYSVLNRSSIKPSSHLQTVIREKENSGPGWFGTAFLIWLLDDDSLSSSDRAWIQQQIDGSKKEAPPPLLEASDTDFTWDIPTDIKDGQQVTISVSAVSGKGKMPVTPECDIGGYKSLAAEDKAVLHWTPHSISSAVVRCTANGWIDSRLIAIVGKERKET